MTGAPTANGEHGGTAYVNSPPASSGGARQRVNPLVSQQILAGALKGMSAVNRLAGRLTLMSPRTPSLLVLKRRRRGEVCSAKTRSELKFLAVETQGGGPVYDFQAWQLAAGYRLRRIDEDDSN
jgi:hypothetical protein